MIATMILVVSILGMLHVSMSSVRLNRDTEIYVAASNVVTHQFRHLIGKAGNRDNSIRYDGSSKALVKYIREMQSSLEDAFGFQVNSALDAGTGILYLTFEVPDPGLNYSLNFQTRDPGTNQKIAYGLGRGVVMIYMNEAQIPAEFTAWSTMKKGDDSIPNTKGFDMNANGVYTDDFTSLYTSSSPDESLVIKSLPMTIEVRYYHKVGELNADSTTPTANPLVRAFRTENNLARSGFSRSYVINNDVMSGLTGGG